MKVLVPMSLFKILECHEKKYSESELRENRESELRCCFEDMVY